jgi:asparagine synthetase A
MSKNQTDAQSKKKTKTRVLIKYDVGFENALYIRGQGADLSWEKGKKLHNVAPDEWLWESSLPFKECEFKVLINDKQYEQGENHHLSGGSAIQYTPRFY